MYHTPGADLKAFFDQQAIPLQVSPVTIPATPYFPTPTPLVAPEIEFYLTVPNVDPGLPFTAPVARGGRAEAGQSAFSPSMLNALAPFWDAFRSALAGLGIQADTWIHEVGQTQYEINLIHGDPVAVADQAFLFKYAAKEIAIRHERRHRERAVRQLVPPLGVGQPGAGESGVGLRQPHHRPTHSRERPRRTPGREPHCWCGCQPLA